MQDSAPINFFYLLWVHPVIPPLPPAMLWPEKAVITPICSKFNFVWGGREEVASFTNITEKVATLLTSTVASIQGKGHFFCDPKQGFNLHSEHT